MKSAPMVATMQELGVMPSLSRPHTSDANAFSEALFRTLKYRPSSGIRFVTPDDRHAGREHEILAQRARVYEAARSRRPDQWTRETRNWTPIEIVRLNPPRTGIRHDTPEAA